MKKLLAFYFVILCSLGLIFATSSQAVQNSDSWQNDSNRVGTKYVLTAQIINDAQLNIMEPYCSMALIQPQIVVTAAHCFAKPNSVSTLWYQPSEIYVTAPGIKSRDNTNIHRVAVVKVVLPSDYTNVQVPNIVDMGQKNDVAFLILATPLVNNFMMPVATEDEVKSLKGGQKQVTIFGYGLHSLDPNINIAGPDGLPRSTTAIVEPIGKMPPSAAEESRTLIADTALPNRICEGDSGGPWYASFNGVLKIVGVQSSGQDPICSQKISAHVIYPFLENAVSALDLYKKQPLSVLKPNVYIPANSVKLVSGKNQGQCAARWSGMATEKDEVLTSKDQVNWSILSQVDSFSREEDQASHFCDWSHPMRLYYYANLPNGTYYKFRSTSPDFGVSDFFTQQVKKSDKRYNVSGK